MPHDRRDKPAGGKAHRDQAKSHTAQRAFKNDASHGGADVNKLIHFDQRIFHDDGPGSLSRHRAMLAESNADSCRGKRGRIIDSVPINRV